MRNLTLTALGLALVLAMSISNRALAVPATDDATAHITVTVDPIMEWSDNFAPIVLDALQSQNDSSENLGSVDLYTNGDVNISAENGAVAQLHQAEGGATLKTEYALEFDSDGLSGQSGASNVSYATHDAFLNPDAAQVKHVANDGAVHVTLKVRASNPDNTVADQGEYSADQTLTATWAVL